MENNNNEEKYKNNDIYDKNEEEINEMEKNHIIETIYKYME